MLCERTDSLLKFEIIAARMDKPTLSLEPLVIFRVVVATNCVDAVLLLVSELQISCKLIKDVEVCL